MKKVLMAFVMTVGVAAASEPSDWMVVNLLRSLPCTGEMRDDEVRRLLEDYVEFTDTGIFVLGNTRWPDDTLLLRAQRAESAGKFGLAMLGYICVAGRLSSDNPDKAIEILSGFARRQEIEGCFDLSYHGYVAAVGIMIDANRAARAVDTVKAIMARLENRGDYIEACAMATKVADKLVASNNSFLALVLLVDFVESTRDVPLSVAQVMHNEAIRRIVDILVREGVIELALTSEVVAMSEAYKAIGDFYAKGASYNLAADSYRKAVETLVSEKEYWDASDICEEAAEVFYRANQKERAINFWIKAGELREKLEGHWTDPEAISCGFSPLTSYGKAARTLIEIGKRTEAINLLTDFAYRLEKTFGYGYLTFFGCDSIAAILIELGEVGKAEHLLKSFAEKAEKAREYWRAADAYEAAAEILREAGKTNEAVELLTSFAQRAEKAGEYGSAADACKNAAYILEKTGKTSEAAKLYERVGELYEKAEEYNLAAYAYRDAADLLKNLGRTSKANALYKKAENMESKAKKK